MLSITLSSVGSPHPGQVPLALTSSRMYSAQSCSRGFVKFRGTQWCQSRCHISFYGLFLSPSQANTKERERTYWCLERSGHARLITHVF
ncbi:hypothetical protein Y032_0171g290 [Ancylostoma ceylanicum]|uniref:Uncharacterized protein n=1 Tax=Ancylostoma ceylanicum TaxID=53326 RepID=A0A016SVM3_9BILA|nr:hypothetical protein Y032_0171g290 [Ancylostoma ceylanicum]